MANLISPQIVKTHEQVIYVNFYTAIPSMLATILATFLITRSEPKLPPTLSASQPQMDFFKGIGGRGVGKWGRFFKKVFCFYKHLE